MSRGIKSKQRSYFNLAYDSDSLGKQGMILLEIEFLPCTYEEPLLFPVLEYISIDGEKIQQNRKRYCPTFDHATHAFKAYLQKADN